MAQKGGIIIHRKILDHWVCSNSRHSYSTFEAWVDILLNVNQDTGSPILIDGQYFTALRGQSLRSLDTWGKRWKWDKSKVRRFFNKLQNDDMVVINNEKKTTRITVCNYDTYQGNKNKVDTRSTPNNNIVSKDTINIRKENFKKEVGFYLNNPYKKDILNEFFIYWTEKTHGGLKMRFETEKTWELNLRLARWSSGKFKKTEFKQQKSYNSWNGQDSQN